MTGLCQALDPLGIVSFGDAYGLTLAWASSNEEDGEVIASHMHRFLTKHVIAGQ